MTTKQKVQMFRGKISRLPTSNWSGSTTASGNRSRLGMAAAYGTGRLLTSSIRAFTKRSPQSLKS